MAIRTCLSKKYIFILWLLLSTIAMLGARGCGSVNVFPAEQAVLLQTSLNNSRATMNFPGGLLGVRLVNGPTWTGASGVANFSPVAAAETGSLLADALSSILISSAWAGTVGTPINSNLYTRIGSLTKTYTATLILLLAEEGKLTLEDTVDDWMGAGYYPNSNIATIRQLLNMTAGFTSYTEIDAFNNQRFATPEKEFLPEELVSYARSSATPNKFAPGTKFNYSNTNFVILGLIAQKAGNDSYKNLIENKILTPLNLSRTSVPAGDDRTIPKNYVSGFQEDDGAWEDLTSYSPSIGFSAGNMISTVTNMLDWIQAINESQLLTEYSTHQMMDYGPMTGSGPWDGSEPGYGLGISYIKGAVGHDGEINGYRLSAYKYKDYYFAVVINGVSDTTSSSDVFWNAVRALYPDDDV
ncbi:serine hydrolase domain-containing protein [Maridesulfovibrio hydrothermalis]|uniref:Beta-lactamase n=1 Tax=Maridesulfovibrio hydrothermalis AM13 = DSM 14728 TaxID=1121451 RepID=L0RF34_9BACT|nr:serine hydrolase domain-containing protein [Maridesulfovibrio hydrothermalis]CCO25364.1 Beta-lactamase [Maridesulfovibrio hydrothermalis AM13 = DSM 14728]